MSARLARGWAALALGGAVAVLLLAMVSVRAPGAGAAPAPGSALPLSQSAPIVWSFTTERAGLAGLRVWLAEPPPPEATLRLTLSPVDNPGQELVVAEAPLASASAEGAFEARFEPVWAGSSPYTPTLTLVARLQIDGPTGVQAALQGAAGGAGPAFTPYYQVRPFDRVWPITAMAAGRTGFLGMPSFYALLAYAAVVGLARVIWLVATQSQGEQTPSAEH
jgi:hypothetical protein